MDDACGERDEPLSRRHGPSSLGLGHRRGVVLGLALRGQELARREASVAAVRSPSAIADCAAPRNPLALAGCAATSAGVTAQVVARPGPPQAATAAIVAEQHRELPHADDEELDRVAGHSRSGDLPSRERIGPCRTVSRHACRPDGDPPSPSSIWAAFAWSAGRHACGSSSSPRSSSTCSCAAVRAG